MAISRLVARALAPAVAWTVLSACTPLGPQKPSYIVFFTPYSIELDSEAQRIVSDAAAAARAVPGQAVVVLGYAAPAPATTTQQDLTLSRNRSEAVANTLVLKGVAQSRIVVRPKGSQGGDPGIESRRVEIEFAP